MTHHRAQPVTFGPPERPLFGMYHAPLPSAGCGAGVVLCNSLGHEAMSAHGTYRRLGERLAQTGVHVLRFDYHGTGDSSGNPGDPGRVRAWQDSIGLAIDQLRAIANVRVVDLVGLRFGATLAAVVADERRDVRSLVLWAPCLSGRRYARELQAFQMINDRAGPGNKEEASDDREVAGYVFTADTLRDLRAIDLLKQPHRIASRALIIPRDDLPTDEWRLAKHLEGAGVDAAVCEHAGYASMMRDPEDSIVPFATLDAIAHWIRTQGGTTALYPVVSSRAPSNSLTAQSPTARHLVREESFYFGHERSLFGILSEPNLGKLDRRRPTLVFLNPGGNHRVGPSRMYVSLARDLAALGYLALRFDSAGVGDSRCEGERQESAVASEGDVKAAISYLVNARGVERVVLVGVCSGADLAFQTGLSDPRVVGEVLINPPTLERRTGDGLNRPTQKSRFQSTRYYLSAPLQRKTWSKALRGEVNVRGVAGTLRDRFTTMANARLADWLSRLRGVPLAQTNVERAFCAMSDRGVESLLVFSSNDAGLDMIERHLGRDARKMRGRKNVRLAIVENADHTFTPVTSQGELSRLVTSFVKETFP